MKKLRNPSISEQAKYMNRRKYENLARSKNNAAENWMGTKLDRTSYKWTRQARWGYRIFDFWCHELGVAVEIDGPEHNKGVDGYRDFYNLYRSGILVLRVQNFNEDQAAAVLERIAQSVSWQARRQEHGLTPKGKAFRRWRWKEAGCINDVKVDLFAGGLETNTLRSKHREPHPTVTSAA